MFEIFFRLIGKRNNKPDKSHQKGMVTCGDIDPSRQLNLKYRTTFYIPDDQR